MYYSNNSFRPDAHEFKQTANMAPNTTGSALAPNSQPTHWRPQGHRRGNRRNPSNSSFHQEKSANFHQPPPRLDHSFGSGWAAEAKAAASKTTVTSTKVNGQKAPNRGGYTQRGRGNGYDASISFSHGNMSYNANNSFVGQKSEMMNHTFSSRGYHHTQQFRGKPQKSTRGQFPRNQQHPHHRPYQPNASLNQAFTEGKDMEKDVSFAGLKAHYLYGQEKVKSHPQLGKTHDEKAKGSGKQMIGHTLGRNGTNSVNTQNPSNRGSHTTNGSFRVGQNTNTRSTSVTAQSQLPEQGNYQSRGQKPRDNGSARGGVRGGSRPYNRGSAQNNTHSNYKDYHQANMESSEESTTGDGPSSNSNLHEVPQKNTKVNLNQTMPALLDETSCLDETIGMNHTIGANISYKSILVKDGARRKRCKSQVNFGTPRGEWEKDEYKKRPQRSKSQESPRPSSRRSILSDVDRPEEVKETEKPSSSETDAPQWKALAPLLTLTVVGNGTAEEFVGYYIPLKGIFKEMPDIVVCADNYCRYYDPCSMVLKYMPPEFLFNLYPSGVHKQGEVLLGRYECLPTDKNDQMGKALSTFTPNRPKSMRTEYTVSNLPPCMQNPWKYAKGNAAKASSKKSSPGSSEQQAIQKPSDTEILDLANKRKQLVTSSLVNSNTGVEQKKVVSTIENKVVSSAAPLKGSLPQFLPPRVKAGRPENARAPSRVATLNDFSPEIAKELAKLKALEKAKDIPEDSSSRQKAAMPPSTPPKADISLFEPAVTSTPRRVNKTSLFEVYEDPSVVVSAGCHNHVVTPKVPRMPERSRRHLFKDNASDTQIVEPKKDNSQYGTSSDSSENTTPSNTPDQMSKMD